LKNASNIASARDLFDEHRCQALGAQFFVHTKEVDFGAVEVLGAYAQLDGNSGDESNQFT
jgi:hypothetical protein